MINLFGRLYLRHDNLLASGDGQQTLIISSRKFSMPYVSDQLAMHQAGIIGVFPDLDEADKAFGGRDGLWAALRLKQAKAIIIADRFFAAELLIQYWKSIFKTTTLESLYTLYQLNVNNENLGAYRPSEKELYESSPNAGDDFVEKLTVEQFRVLYNNVEASPALDDLPKDKLPVETLLMSYLSDGCPNAVRKELFKKVDMIIRTNAVAKLTNSREELLFETHNYYLLSQNQEQVIIDPLEYLEDHPYLSWVLDEDFKYGNEAQILIKYSLAQLRFFFETHETLLRDHHDEIQALKWIENKQYAQLIEFDINDQKGNFFGTTAFVSKINGLLVSYLYQLKRLGRGSELKPYELK